MIEKKWHLNDTFAQYWRNVKIVPEDIAKGKMRYMKYCDHLFVRLNGLDIDGSKNFFTVECVHCGLTNKFFPLEAFFGSNPRTDFSLPKNTTTLQSQMFMKMMNQNKGKNDQNWNESNLVLMSEEILPTYHPGLLYQLALQIKCDATVEELFEVMKELQALETDIEALHLQTPEQANALLSRYRESIKQPKVYNKN